MVFVRKTYRRASAYQGDGLLSSIRKIGKTVAKAVKSPVGKVAHRIYNKTLAPVAKQALTAAVGEKLATSLENAGKRTLDGENIDSALAGEAKALAQSEIQSKLAGITGKGVRFTKPMRTSDMIRGTANHVKIVRPKASAVMQRIQGDGIVEDTVL